MTTRFWVTGLLALLGASAGADHAAWAHAWAGIEYSGFSFTVSDFNAPDVIDSLNLSWGPGVVTTKTIAATGNASGSGDVSCDAGGSEIGCAASASAEATANGTATVKIKTVGTLYIENTSSTDLSYVVIDGSFSAFNPGGPSAGASVDDTATEYASFNSSVSDPSSMISDTHGCNTNFTVVDSSGYAGPTNGGLGAVCGVAGPDASDFETSIALIPAGATVAVDELTLEIDLTASAGTPPTVPEPLSVPLLTMAIGTLAAVRRTRA